MPVGFWSCPSCGVTRRKSADLEIYSSGRVVGKVPNVGCISCRQPLDYRKLLAGGYDAAPPSMDHANREMAKGAGFGAALGAAVGAYSWGCGHAGRGLGLFLGMTAIGFVVGALNGEGHIAADEAKHPKPSEDVISLEPPKERKPLTPEQMALVEKLIAVGRKIPDARSSSTYLNVGRRDAREIGEALNAAGGLELMLAAHENVVAALGGVAGRELEACWGGIGQWLS